MSVARRKLTAAATALGLGLSVVAHAAGSSAHPPAKHRGGARHSHRPRVAILEGPGKRFDQSVEVAHREAASAEARAAQASGVATGSTGTGSTAGFPSPESLGVSSATLDSIAVSADGSYRGLFQFDSGTWASVGGSGDPAAAPVAEQDYRAALLYSRGGSSPWPICG